MKGWRHIQSGPISLLLWLVLLCGAWRLQAVTLKPPLVASVHSRIIFVEGGTMVWGVGDGMGGSSWLIGVDVPMGAERWRAALAGAPKTAVVAGTNCFAFLQDQRLEARETSSGQVVWATNLAAIPRQFGLIQESFDGVLSEDERTSTRRMTDVAMILRWYGNETTRSHRLVSLGGTNVAVFGEEFTVRAYQPIWEDWHLFGGRTGIRITSGEGSMIGLTAEAVIFRASRGIYRLSGSRVTRGPEGWDSGRAGFRNLYRTNQQERMRVKTPTFVDFLQDDGSRVTRLDLGKGQSEDDGWWMAATNLVRIARNRSARAEGWSVSGEKLWRIEFPQPEFYGEQWLDWLGEDGVAHYFCGLDTVIRVVPGKLTSERIIPASGETASTNSLWAMSTFALAPAKAVLLEATGEQEWRMAPTGAPVVPSTQAARLTGRDPATGKILWSKSETIVVKRARE